MGGGRDLAEPCGGELIGDLLHRQAEARRGGPIDRPVHLRVAGLRTDEIDDAADFLETLLGTIGDRITIMNFAHYSPEEAVFHQPRIIVLDEKNRVVRKDGVPTFTHGRSDAELQ